jgi:hypothetical protein
MSESRIVTNSDGDNVAINHGHLDKLIGNLMHLCELNSDKEFRNAMKSEIKQRCREWLNNEFTSAGYGNTVIPDNQTASWRNPSMQPPK